MPETKPKGDKHAATLSAALYGTAYRDGVAALAGAGAAKIENTDAESIEDEGKA